MTSMDSALSLGSILSAAIPLRAVPAMEDDDARLVERIRRGDRRAFDLLYRRHADDVYRRMTRLVGPHPEREDLVQEVFVAAFRGLDRFRGDARLTTWLYRVAVNVAYAHLRRRRAYDLDAAVDLELMISGDASPETSAMQRQELIRALRFLDRLKPKKRIAFVLRIVEGLSLDEIGALVGARPAAVGQRVRHAKRELDAMIARDDRRAEVRP
jgi:RNA polymerase sigma-70 factor (ECF subfamily)